MRPTRVTKERVYEIFRLFCKKASKVCVDSVSQEERPLVGGWRLDYHREKLTFDETREFGGYIIIEEEEDFDESYPFGHKHRPAREMVDTMNFCMSMLEILRIDEAVRSMGKMYEEFAGERRKEVMRDENTN